MTADNRREVRFFVSYAQKNQSLAAKFRDRLDDQLKPSKTYRFLAWQDIEILPGLEWKAEIGDALKKCDIGLLLITPSFLSSSFIREYELPAFVGGESGAGPEDGRKPFIPVLLSDVNDERHDLAGLKKTQIYAYKATNGHRKSFHNCNGSQREAFVAQLHERIESRLDRLFGR